MAIWCRAAPVRDEELEDKDDCVCVGMRSTPSTVVEITGTVKEDKDDAAGMWIRGRRRRGWSSTVRGEGQEDGSYCAERRLGRRLFVPSFFLLRHAASSVRTGSTTSGEHFAAEAVPEQLCCCQANRNLHHDQPPTGNEQKKGKTLKSCLFISRFL